MKYFFVVDQRGKTHIVVAEDIDQAKALASESVKVETCYELMPDTFSTPGFLISD